MRTVSVSSCPPLLVYIFLPLYHQFLLPLPLHFSLLPHLSLLPQAALVETDSRSDDLEKRNHLLEGEVADLRQNLKEQSQADEHIMALMNAKTKEWQVSCDPPASSFPPFVPPLISSSLFVLCSSFLPLDLRAWQKYLFMTIPLAVSLCFLFLLFLRQILLSKDLTTGLPIS